MFLQPKSVLFASSFSPLLASTGNEDIICIEMSVICFAYTIVRVNVVMASCYSIVVPTVDNDQKSSVSETVVAAESKTTIPTTTATTAESSHVSIVNMHSLSVRFKLSGMD